jgi:hypothetical protein
MRSHKIALGLALIVVLASFGVGCGEKTSSESAFSTKRAENLGNVREDDSDLDLGEDWDPQPGADGRRSGHSGRSGRSGGPQEAPTPSYWAVVLRTFAGDNSRQSAANMVRSCVQVDPKLRDARVHFTEEGAMVIYGRYEDATAADAQAGLAWVKGIEVSGRQVFPRAILTRISTEPRNRRYSAIELLSVRSLYPDVHPLYTLQVGVWGDYESGKLTLDQIRRSAEAQARQLRAEGMDAYVHHDTDLRLSTVTIGLFDRTALDPQTGFIVDPMLEMLKQRYPYNLANGEELREPLDPKRPSAGTRIQESRLVLVPKK